MAARYPAIEIYGRKKTPISDAAGWPLVESVLSTWDDYSKGI